MSEPTVIAIAIVVWACCTLAGWAIGRTKSLAKQGLFYGLFLGVLGVVLIALYPTPSSHQRKARPAPAPSGPEQRIASLKRLLDDGLVSPDEYEAKRAKILRDQ